MSTLDGSATEDDLKTYNNDWMDKYHGKSQVVARPRTTDEVSKIMAWCYENDIAVVPQGGNTGLVGESPSDPRGRVPTSSIRPWSQWICLTNTDPHRCRRFKPDT